MKRIFLAVLCVGLLLAGCAAAPATQGDVPCLPGLEWGMTRDQACEALGWELNEAVATLVDGKSNEGVTAYTFSSKKVWDVPTKSVRLEFEEAAAPLDRGLISVGIEVLPENQERLSQSFEKLFGLEFPKAEGELAVLRGAECGDTFTAAEWEQAKKQLRLVQEQFSDLDEDIVQGRTEDEVWNDTMRNLIDTPLTKVMAVPAEDGTVLFRMDGLYAAMLNRMRAGN